MKSSLLITGLLLSTIAFAKTEERKPASLDSELVHSYIKTADLLAQARNQNQVCDVDAYQSEVINNLEKAKYRDSFSPTMITPSIKTALAGTIFIKEITGEVKLEFNATPADYQKALVDTYFESPSSGVYGPLQKFTLKANGIIEFSNTQVLNEEPWSQETTTKGTWGVKIKEEKYGKIVRIWWKVGNKTKVYRLERSYGTHDNGWILKTKSKESQSEDYLNNKFYNGINSECEA